MVKGEDPRSSRVSGCTLREALHAYIDWLGRKNRRQRTVNYYRFNIEKYLKDWLDKPLVSIGHDRQGIRARHLYLTEKHGPHTGNAVMRSLRAVYRYERE